MLDLKSKIQSQNLEQKKEQISLLNEIKEQKQENILKKHESKLSKVTLMRKAKKHVAQTKVGLTKDFLEKKTLILKKLAELKK